VKVDTVVENCRAATLCGLDWGPIPDAVLPIADGRIAWVGERSAAPRFESAAGTGGPVRIDGAGGWLTPGLVDCHTHLVHAGDRAQEFEARLQGARYEEISRAGGGSPARTRCAS
jgi:imidazolonepropionase